MGEAGDVGAVGGEHVAEGEAAGAGEGLAGHLVEVPLVGAHRLMEPQRVVEADRHDPLGRQIAVGSP